MQHIDRLENKARSDLRNDGTVRILRWLIHFFSYHLILRRGSPWPAQAAGMRLTVRPTVFHPRYFIGSARFAEFIDTLDLRGKQVIDVGTGTGILAIAAARAGAEKVIATDINPNAALSVPGNARANGAGDRVSAACMDLLSGFVARPLFDVIVANVPKNAGEPRDLADKGWYGGQRHRYILPLFEQAYQRLKQNGRLYVLLSSHSELDVIENVIAAAGFGFRIVKEYPMLIESLVLYECTR
jgi:release factor glutamine methyltransferase